MNIIKLQKDFECIMLEWQVSHFPFPLFHFWLKDHRQTLILLYKCKKSKKYTVINCELQTMAYTYCLWHSFIYSSSTLLFFVASWFLIKCNFTYKELSKKYIIIRIATFLVIICLACRKKVGAVEFHVKAHWFIMP